MTAAQQQQAAKKFAAYWKDKGYEKGESQPFWLSLLRDVYGVEHPEQFILFEEQVHLDHTSFIDGTIPATHVLIEQKGLGKDLNKPIKQSGCKIYGDPLCKCRKLWYANYVKCTGNNQNARGDNDGEQTG